MCTGAPSGFAAHLPVHPFRICQNQGGLQLGCYGCKLQANTKPNRSAALFPCLWIRIKFAGIQLVGLAAGVVDNGMAMNGLEIPWAMGHVFSKISVLSAPISIFPSSTYRRLADFSVQNGFSATVLLKQRLTFHRLAVAKFYQSTGGSYDANNMKRVTMIVPSLCDMFMPHFWQKQFHMISYWSPSCEMTTDDKKILKHSETWTVPVHCPVCVDCDVCRPLRSERSSWPTDPIQFPQMDVMQVVFFFLWTFKKHGPGRDDIWCKQKHCTTTHPNANCATGLDVRLLKKCANSSMSLLCFHVRWKNRALTVIVFIDIDFHNGLTAPKISGVQWRCSAIGFLGNMRCGPGSPLRRFFQTKIVHTGICFLYMSV